MRPGEAISTAALLCFIVLGPLCRLERSRQYQVIQLGCAGIAAVLALQALSIPYPKTAQVIGDWLPALLILIVYWQSGRFFKVPKQTLQCWLEKFDQQRMGRLLGQWERHWSKTWLGAYFEIAYSLCYVLIPAGVAILYLAHLRSVIDLYWTTVASASFLCYLVIPFAPTVPPRLRHRNTSPVSKFRAFNLAILRRVSIQLNTFPSAHVASTVAASLVLLWTVPAAGTVFLILSLSIGAGAALGRYHYTLDVILGVFVPVAVFLFTLSL